jgi:hypothetical protein
VLDQVKLFIGYFSDFKRQVIQHTKEREKEEKRNIMREIIEGRRGR